ncbi:uroporphyrinogen decarboxylase family protein, partial [Nonomuraea sp. NPDC050663]
ATEILRRGSQAEGHVFNLGHGVLPSTDPDQLKRLVELIHTAPTSDGASA